MTIKNNSVDLKNNVIDVDIPAVIVMLRGGVWQHRQLIYPFVNLIFDINIAISSSDFKRVA